MKNIKLAEALLRRKELDAKVKQLHQINVNNCWEVKARRQKVTDDLDDIVAQVPKVTASQITEEYDYYAKCLRMIDAKIQQANWNCEITLDEYVLNNYKRD